MRTRVQRHRAGATTVREDVLAGEEPLEIRVGGAPLAVTMRTPGADIDLVHGFLHSEGMIGSAADVAVARYCDGADEAGRNTYNVLDVQLAPGLAVDPARRRLVAGTSACGVCGTSSIDAIARQTRHPLASGPLVRTAALRALPQALRDGQRNFAATGGTHASALADADGRILLLREDVGRHNAMDKVIGAALLGGNLPLTDGVLVTSSRASFELVQKAVLAGCGVLVAVSAPTSLAVDLARDRGLTLVAFAGADGFNVYSGADRIG